MTTYKVTTPVDGYTGAVGAVAFAAGEALVDDETHAAELAYLRGAGYHVEELGADASVESEDGPKRRRKPKKTTENGAEQTNPDASTQEAQS